MTIKRVVRGVAMVGVATVLVWLFTGRSVHYGALATAAAVADSSPSPAFVVERVTLTTLRGRALTCLLRQPATLGRARGGGVGGAALLVAGGQRTGRRAVLYLDSAYAGVALSCDYPWAELARARGLAFVVKLPRLRAEILATPEALAAAATYLAQRAGPDAPMAGLGASLGVPPVAAWAARDSRPRAVALLYGGGPLWRLFAANLEEDVRVAWLRPIVARALGAALRPIEPTRTVGAIAPRPVLVLASADDPWIPRETVEALYLAAGEPRRLVWFHGVHMRTGDAALLKALADSTLAWLGEVLPAGGNQSP